MALAISGDIHKNYSSHCHFKVKFQTINYFQQDSQKVWIGMVQNEHLKKSSNHVFVSWELFCFMSHWIKKEIPIN